MFDFLSAYNVRTLAKLGTALLDVAGSAPLGPGVPRYASMRLGGWGALAGSRTARVITGVSAALCPDGYFTGWALLSQLVFTAAWLQDIAWAYGRQVLRPVALRTLSTYRAGAPDVLLCSPLVRTRVYGAARSYSLRRPI